MKNTESLKKYQDFLKVYKEGKSFANKQLVMYARQNHTETNRLGISVSKKVGNSVVRHRLKRVIKEIYRLNEERFLSGLDIVIVVRVAARGKDYPVLESAVNHLGNLHGILDVE